MTWGPPSEFTFLCIPSSFVFLILSETTRLRATNLGNVVASFSLNEDGGSSDRRDRGVPPYSASAARAASAHGLRDRADDGGLEIEDRRDPKRGRRRLDSPASLASLSDYWGVVGDCELSDGGRCVGSGGRYSNSESCTATTQSSFYIYTARFDIEPTHDWVRVDGVEYTSDHYERGPDGLYMAAGEQVSM